MSSSGKAFFKNLVVDSFKRQKSLALLVITLVVTQKYLDLCIPVVSSKIIDLISQLIITNNKKNFDTEILYKNFFLLLTVWILSTIFYPLQSYFSSRFVQSSIYRASVLWMKTILSKKFSFFSESKLGAVVSATNRGISASERYLAAFCEVLSPLIIDLILTVYLLVQSTHLSGVLLIIVTSTLQGVVGQLLIKKRTRDICYLNEIEDAQSDDLIEKLRSAKIFKIEQAQDFALMSLTEKFFLYSRAATKVSFSGALINVLNISVGQLTTIILLALILVSPQSWSVGAVMSTLFLSARLSATVSAILQNSRSLNQFKADVDKFNQILCADSDEKHGLDFDFVDEIEIANVNIEHKDFALKIDRLHIEKNEKIAIIGPSGSGKSTLLELLAGIDDLSATTLSVNQNMFHQLSTSSFRKAVRYCPQKNFILSGSLNEGVFFKAKEQLDYKTILSRLGFDSRINEHKINNDGQNISGGEARRLALSRLFAKSGQVFILDEPTSSLDEISSELVINYLFEHCFGKTLIMTTHDYQHLEKFDRIWIVKNGRIVEDGTPFAIFQSDQYRQLISNNH